MKNLVYSFFAIFCSLVIVTAGLTANIVNVETHPVTTCAESCNGVGWLSLTFDAGTELTGGAHEFGGDYLTLQIASDAPLCQSIDYQISGADSTPVLTPGLPAGSYGPVTLTGGPITGTGGGIYFLVRGNRGDRSVFISIISEDASSITAPEGGLTLTLFDSLPHHGFLWKKNAEGNYVDGVESSDNSLQLETNRAHEAEVLASLESNCGLYFVGDCLLAHLLFAQADAGPNQVVFDAVELSGSGSPGTIVQYDWQLLHWDNSQFNRAAAGVSPTISNLEPGFYTVVLTVTNDLGCGGESSKILAAAGPCRRTSASSYLLLLDVRLEPLVRHRF